LGDNLTALHARRESGTYNVTVRLKWSNTEYTDVTLNDDGVTYRRYNSGSVSKKWTYAV
jgi:hypothetical protein